LGAIIEVWFSRRCTMAVCARCAGPLYTFKT